MWLPEELEHLKENICQVLRRKTVRTFHVNRTRANKPSLAVSFVAGFHQDPGLGYLLVPLLVLICWSESSQ